MRIISGIYKGRNLKGYTIDGTRPTQDRIKESVFSMIQTNLRDSVVLDLFAGSGNLGIEALSNGATEAYFIDKNKISCRTIEDNLRMLNIRNGYVYCLDYLKALKKFKHDNITFDIVFLDPPYKDLILGSILEQLHHFRLLNKNALVICEYETKSIEEYEYFDCIKEKKYGSKFVNIYCYRYY